MNIAVSEVALTGFVLALARVGAFIAIAPPFSTAFVPRTVRAGLAVALAFCFSGTVTAEDLPIGLGATLGAIVAQVVAGFVLGLCVQIMLTAASTAGELIDSQVGFSFGREIDPLGGPPSSPYNRLYQFLATTVLFVGGGHLLIIAGLRRSMQAAPLGGINIEAIPTELPAMAGNYLTAALEIALPVFATLLLVEVALGLVAKAAPQLQIMVVGFAVKSVLAFICVGACVVLLPNATGELVRNGISHGARLLVGS